MQDCVPDRPARTPDCDPVSLGTPFGPIAARLLFPSLDNASEDDAFPSSEIDFGRASVDPGVVPVLLVVSPPESAGNPAQGRRDVKADRRWCTAEAAVKLRPHADEERAGGEDGRSAVCPLEVITSAAVSPAENGRPEGPCRPKVAATMGYIHFVNKRNMQAQLFFWQQVQIYFLTIWPNLQNYRIYSFANCAFTCKTKSSERWDTSLHDQIYDIVDDTFLYQEQLTCVAFLWGLVLVSSFSFRCFCVFVRWRVL